MIDPFIVIGGAAIFFIAVLLGARLYIRRSSPSVRLVRDEAGRIVHGYAELRIEIDRERAERIEGEDELAGKINALRRDVEPLLSNGQRRRPIP